jgi:hypothetical protein
MARVSLINRLKAVTGYRGRKARARLFNELVNEGYHPSEIVSALECLGEDGPILLAGGNDARYRFLAPEEQRLLTPPAKGRLLRMQKLGFIDAFQADMILTIIGQSDVPLTGLKRLSEIISQVCDSGDLLIRLDTRHNEKYLN